MEETFLIIVKIVAGVIIAIFIGISALLGILMRVLNPSTIEGLIGLGAVLFLLRMVDTGDRLTDKIKKKILKGQD